MGGYSKNIAVIKGLKEGFSADGGALTGLIRAERYGSSVKIEVTFINFAPLSEGRYLTAVSDGSTTVIVENGLFEGTSQIDTAEGFAALICYVNGQVSPVASAVSGNFHGVTLGLKEEIERAENIKARAGGTAFAQDNETFIYEDEAIAEENYYEFAKTDEGGGALRADTQKKEGGYKPLQDEAAFSAFKKEQGGLSQSGENGRSHKQDGRGKNKGGANEGGNTGPLSHSGNFYERMRSEIENVLKNYPAEDALEKTVENSRWVRITYGDGKFYVFGLLYDGTSPAYICYGVPTEQSERPPESMKGMASFIPASPQERQKGYWVMYQDALTGVRLKIDVE